MAGAPIHVREHVRRCPPTFGVHVLMLRKNCPKGLLLCTKLFILSFPCNKLSNSVLRCSWCAMKAKFAREIATLLVKVGWIIWIMQNHIFVVVRGIDTENKNRDYVAHIDANTLLSLANNK